MKLKILRVILLYILVGITSILSIVCLGIIGLPNNIGGKIAFWLIAGFISYSMYVYIPFFRLKEKKYYDGFLLAWAYAVIIIVISFRTNNFEEYDYFIAFTFLSGLPLISEVLLMVKRKRINGHNLNYQDEIIKRFMHRRDFVILDVINLFNISEYKARKILNKMIESGNIYSEKIGTKYYYRITKGKIK